MRCLAFTVALGLWSQPLLSQAEQVDAAEQAFDAGRADVQELMGKAKWADAKAALQKLLAAHEGKIYVQAQRDAIVADFTACCFYAQARMPELRDVLDGKVASWSERTGKVKLQYDNLAQDWEDQDGLFVHPAVFAGSYSITLKGKSYPHMDEPLRVFFDLDTSGGVHVAGFGYGEQDVGNGVSWLPASIWYYGPSKGDERLLGKDRSKAEPGERYTATVRVSSTRVDLLYNKRSMLRVKREDAGGGQVGIVTAGFDLVELEGKLEPGWFQSCVDEELAKQRAEFDKTFRANQELPKWLFEQPRIERTPPRRASWLPGVRGRISPGLSNVLDLWRDGKLPAAREALTGLSDDDAEPVTRRFIDASLLLARGRGEEAIVISEKLVAEDPESSQLAVLHADILDSLGRGDDAITTLRAALGSDPGEPRVYDKLCVALMSAGHADEAARVVRSGKTRHGLWDDLAQLDTLLAMAARGPAFARRFSYRTTHYEVVSDIDTKVCQRACAILEASYVNLMAQFSWLRSKRKQPRFRVFLFSGEDGYQAYCQAILGSTAPHTAGLYSPVLKQLLIWNLPKREDMERTIRHEGFHQFLDRLMSNPPTWLNEGTAEYWETAEREQGRLTGGQVRRDHIATLVRSRRALPSPKDFVYGNRADFYANAQLRYAQAWATVHFLRESGRKNAALFEKLWEELRSAGSTRNALDAAFAKVDWEEFETAFWEHLDALKN